MKYTKIIARKKGKSSSKVNVQMTVVKELRSKNKSVDSAYETDRSGTLSASQKGYIDPYELDMEDDKDTVKKKTKKKQVRNHPQKTLSAKDSRTKKTPGHKIKSTSTPVLQQCSNSNDSSSVTPEVTPILAVKPFIDASPNSRSFITPQLARSARKRECNASVLMSISKQLNYSSLIDSGIDLSSPPAKKKLTETLAAWRTKKNLSQKELCSKENNLNATMTKKHSKAVVKNILLENSSNNMKQPENPSNHLEHLCMVDSCFGFDSLVSPQISPPDKIKNRKFSVKSSHRLRSSTSLERRLKDCLCSPQEAEDNISSPLSLFAEDVPPSRSECLKVNKSSIKSYKSSFRKLKKQSVSKIDEWASNFNMEIEEIEKMDLCME